MADCSNVEMRDRLPDLVNDSLGAAERDLLLIHLGECAACTAEIEVLRTTRLILVTTTPKVNVAGIAMALPSYASLRSGQAPVRSIESAPSAARRGWANSWRVAAAVTFLAAGIGSYAMLGPDSPVRPDSTRLTGADTTIGVALTGALADMSDDELHALASDIANIEALPSAEVQYPGYGVNVPTILPDSVVRDQEI